MENTNEKIMAAIEILKAAGISGIGKVRAYINEVNANIVDIFTEDGLYCSINVRSRKVSGI